VVPPQKRVTVTVQATTGAATTPTTEAPAQTLKPGDTGSQVKVLQQALKALGFPAGTPDGDYGPSTQNAVEQFQASKNLTADGIVGPDTLDAIRKALSG
jgi:peptidoglycan hydrolase-like protein with peptidoglycan-binding domain